MTIQKAIDTADRLRPNQYSEQEKVEWLSTLDKKVYEEVMKISVGMEEGEFAGYDEDTDMDTELLICGIYEDAYIDFLISQYDYYNREMGMYNNSATIFNTKYQEYCSWYRRNNMPIQHMPTEV